MDFRTFVLALLALLMLTISSPVLACTCKPVDTATLGLQAADAVFEAVVAEMKMGEGGANIVTMNVVRAWKGIRHEQVKVTTAMSSAMCGFSFQEGESYLVYAAMQGGMLHTTLCSRTRLTDLAADDIAELGAGVTPVDVDDELDAPTSTSAKHAQVDASAAGCQSCSAGEHGTDFSPLLIAGALFFRRRRKL